MVAGHVCLDLTPSALRSAAVAPGALVDVGPLAVSLGGSVANTGRALHALGVPVRAAALIGDDELGGVLRRLLEATGLGIDDVRIAPGAATSYSVVLQPDDADRAFLHHTGANEYFDGADLDLAGTDLLHVGYPSLLPRLLDDDGGPLVALFSRARDAGVLTSLDLAVVDPASPLAGYDWSGFLDRVLPLTDVVSPSADDLDSVLGPGASPLERARDLVARGAGVAAVSAGADGLTLVAGGSGPAGWAGAELDAVPDPLPAVTTSTGAGDASTAGLLAALLAGATPEEAVARSAASARAALTGGLR